MDILSRIQGPEDLKKLSLPELEELAEEIRRFLVEHVSLTGGHLASNLGVVELTLALLCEFDLPKDKLIYDVGHQSYVHKILTGRRDRFDSLRQKDGISGFPKGRESEYDAFDTGHASTSISAAYGLAKARDLRGEDYEIAALIGDGALTGGMAYEAMNNAGRDKTKLIVILNDNEMAIGRNVGSLSQHLGRLRTRQGYLRSKKLVKESVARHPGLRPLYESADKIKNRVKYMLVQGILFEEMGFTYLGPVDGHDIKALREVLREAKLLKEPVIVHVVTTKGKGYAPAQMSPEEYHGISCSVREEITWAKAFGQVLSECAKEDASIVAVTAAMADGVGLKDVTLPPSHIFDVGIAEEHAVTFAAGLCKGGMKPCVAIYSTFLQRAYDQIIHDVAMTGLHVVFAVDHSGLVGEDGETHQGTMDTAFLSDIPGMTLMAPCDQAMLDKMLRFAFSYDGPVAVKYPKGNCPRLDETLTEEKLAYGKGAIIRENRYPDRIPVTILSVGDRLAEAVRAAEQMEEDGAGVQVVDVRFLAPFDEELVRRLLQSEKLVITVEEQIRSGSFGMRVKAIAGEEKASASVISLTLPDAFIPQGKRSEELHEYGLDAEGILEAWKTYRKQLKKDGSGSIS